MSKAKRKLGLTFKGSIKPENKKKAFRLASTKPKYPKFEDEKPLFSDSSYEEPVFEHPFDDPFMGFEDGNKVIW